MLWRNLIPQNVPVPHDKLCPGNKCLTCRKLESTASHRRTELLHHHHTVLVERPLQQSDDSHTCRESVTPEQLGYTNNKGEVRGHAHHLLPYWSVLSSASHSPRFFEDNNRERFNPLMHQITFLSFHL